MSDQLDIKLNDALKRIEQNLDNLKILANGIRQELDTQNAKLDRITEKTEESTSHVTLATKKFRRW